MLVIQKPVTLPSGSQVTHHAIGKIEISPDGRALLVFGSSWGSAEARVDGCEPIDRFHIRIPIDAACPALMNDIGQWLVSSDLLAGGAITPAEILAVEDVRLARWAYVKARRMAAEFGPFEFEGLVFDADQMSQARIQGAVQLAVLSLQAGGNFAIDWTLADNTVVTLSAAQMLGVGQALAANVQAAYDTARVLRQQIEAAGTAEAIGEVRWPD